MSSEKSPNKNEHVVIAFFPSQEDADDACEDLKIWDDADDDIKLGAVGILAMENGKVKTHVGSKTGRGTVIGVVLGVIAGVLTGGVGLLGGLLVGGVAGGAIGAFMKDSLHMTKEEIEALGPELQAGKVALVVTCDDYEVGPTQEQLNDLGGEVRGYAVPAAALAEAANAGIGADVPTTAEAAGMAATPALSAEEAKTLAEDAYSFGLPLVYIALQEDTETNVAKAEGLHAPLNQFRHFRQFPDASNKSIVGFNVDTLYSLADLDLSQGPIVLSVPEMGDRYWLMQLIDGWNNVPYVAGSRTVGGQGGDFAITGPFWRGEVPAGMTEVRMPTNIALLGGRTYTASPEDYEAVHTLQDQYKLTPLAAWGTEYEPPTDVPIKPGVDTTTPVPKQVLAMPTEDFFNRLNSLLVNNPPNPDDPAIMARIAKLNIGPGMTFSMDAFDPTVRTAIEEGVAAAKAAIPHQEMGKHINGWQVTLDMGRYGARYPYRAAWTFFGVGGNVIEDACYPLTQVDSDDQPLDAADQYTLTFAKEGIPPVNAFWSLTMYDMDAYLVPNAINRYALGDRSNLQANEDGSLTLYIQKDTPGAEKESNWLPTPQEGGFKLALRLYSPKPEVASGAWQPPGVQRVA